MNAPKPMTSRLLSRFYRVSGGLGLVIIFLTSLFLGVILHLDLPISRRGAADFLERYLSADLQGTVRIGSLSKLEEGGISANEIEVLDPQGRSTLKIKRLIAHIDLFGIADRILAGHEKLSVEISGITAEGCEIYLLPTAQRDKKGHLLTHASLQDAFSPVKTAKKKKAKKKKSKRPVRIWFPHILLKDVYARGSIAGSPVVESRIKEARSKLLVTDKGLALDVDRFALSASGLLGVDTKAYGEVHVRAPGAVWGKISGELGTIPIEQDFRFEDGKFDLTTVPVLKPESLRPLLGTWPFDQPITLRNRAKGTPDQFELETAIKSFVGQGEVATTVLGTVSTKEKKADVKITTTELDLSSLLSALPRSKISADARLHSAWSSANPRAEIEVDVAPGEIDGHPTPQGSFKGTWSSTGWTAEGHVEEDSVRLQIEASGVQDGPIRFKLVIPQTNLAAIPRLAKSLRADGGDIQGVVSGTYDGKLIQANLDLLVGDLKHSGFSVSSARLISSAQIPVNNPEETIAETTISASNASFGEISLLELTAKQSGAILHPNVQIDARTRAGMLLSARAKVEAKERRVTDFHAELRGSEKPVVARAKAIRFADGSLTIRQFSVKSIGEISGDLNIGRNGGRIDVQAQGLNVSRIGRSLGLAATELAGKLDASIDLEIGEGSTGSVNLKLRDGAYQGFSGISLDGYAQIDGRTTSGKLNGEVVGLLNLETNWEGRLAGSVLDPASFMGAEGEFEANLQRVDLTTLKLLLGSKLPVSSLGGELDFDISARQSSEMRFPQITVEAQSRDLDVAYGVGSESVRSRGVNFSFVSKIPSSGESIDAVVRLTDKAGTIASLSGDMLVPWTEWAQSPPKSEEFRGELLHGVMNWVAVIPRRSINRWPNFIPRPFEAGEFSARAAITGTLAQPNANVVISANALEGGASPFSEPIELTSNLRYASSTGALGGSIVFNRDTQRMGSLQLDVTIPYQHLTDTLPAKTPFWTGRTQLQLDSSPLELVSRLKDAGLKGTALGTIAIQRDSYLPELAAELSLRRIAAGENFLGDARLESQSYGSQLATRINFRDDYGSMIATANLGLLPTPYLFEADTGRAINLNLQSKRYDAAVLLPFVSEAFDELSGALDGKLTAELIPTGNPDSPWDTHFFGQMGLTDGVLHPTSLGIRLVDTNVSLYAERVGSSNVVRLENLRAKADSKKENVRGRAEMIFKNLDLTGGAFELHAESMPFVAGGAKVADVTGGAIGKFLVKDGGLRLALSLNDFTASLPETTEDELIDLNDNPTITIVQNQSLEIQATKDQDETPLLIQVTLGENVRIRNSLLDLRLRGRPQIRVAEKTEFSGAIDLVRGGRFVVLGRSFIMERGIVLFDTGNASNPHIQATAAWTAPNGVLVRVAVGGTVRNPTLEWSSEPALSGGEADVIALVLGSGGGADQGSVGMSSLAIAANEAIGATGLNWMEFYTTQEAGSGEGRVASLTDSSWNSYTAAFQISDELWFEGNFQSGSTGFQAEQRRGVSGTLDWRFHPNWSARTEVGTLGGGLDLLWQYRY